ncbi:MAG: phage major capsid protein [Candidatus Nanopelagicales bacterium]
MADILLGEVAASVWDKKIGGKPNDVVFNSRALFYLLKEGFQESAGGGKTFEFTIEHSENPNFKSYGEYDLLDTGHGDTFDAAQFTAKIHAGTVKYSELEKARAQADSGKFDLIAAKLENGKNTAIANLNRAFFGDGTGNGGLDVDGLQKIIATDPVTGTVGGIDRGTYSFWRNRQTSGVKSSTAFDNLRSTMRTVYGLCRGGGSNVDTAPTGFITTQTVLNGFESILVANERYAKDGTKNRGGNAGFDEDAFFFKGAKGLADEDCPSGNLYFLNPSFLKVVYLKGYWLKMYPEVDPANQLANIHKVATFAQMCTSNPRRLGCVTGIS